MKTSWTTVPSIWKADSDCRLVYTRCNRKCNCIIKKLRKYEKDSSTYDYSPRKKAGVIMTTKNFGKFLIVQSRGRLWGVPKGGMEAGETSKECAFREFREETGIKEDLDNFDISSEISVNHGKYFCIHNQIEHPVELTDEYDSTGVGWITRQCMRDLEQRKLVKFTADFKKILEVI
tara:strand:- start:853 stop:1380 length:528 start_codon:yes stop_codon:yes gene_type:complete